MALIDKVSHRRDRARAEREVSHGVYQIDGLEGVRIILDVGAYHGSFVRHAKRLYPAAYVHCYEPDARSYERLVETTKDLKRVIYHAAAMAANAGVASFNQAAVPSCSTLDKRLKPARGVDDVTVVACETLPGFIDNLSPRLSIDILKLDCEGAEAEILESLSEDGICRIRYVTGEWHGVVARDRVMRALFKTHDAEFTIVKPQRGYFYAKRR